MSDEQVSIEFSVEDWKTIASAVDTFETLDIAAAIRAQLPRPFAVGDRVTTPSGQFVGEIIFIDFDGGVYPILVRWSDGARTFTHPTRIRHVDEEIAAAKVES